MLKIRNYHTAIVKALDKVPHVSYLMRSTLISTAKIFYLESIWLS